MKLMLHEMKLRNPDMPEKKLLALFSLKTGISMKTANTYLEELEEAVRALDEKEEPLNIQKTLDQQGGK